MTRTRIYYGGKNNWPTAKVEFLHEQHEGLVVLKKLLMQNSAQILPHKCSITERKNTGSLHIIP
jgi:hypothetical protein